MPVRTWFSNAATYCAGTNCSGTGNTDSGSATRSTGGPCNSVQWASKARCRPSGPNLVSCGMLACTRRTEIGVPAGCVQDCALQAGPPSDRQGERAGDPQVAHCPARARRHGDQRERSGQQRGGQRHAVDARHRRESCQQAVAVRIAGGKPRETGEQRSAQPLAERPGGRQRQRQPDPRTGGRGVGKHRAQGRDTAREMRRTPVSRHRPTARASARRHAC